jgi:hypothetical protein
VDVVRPERIPQRHVRAWVRVRVRVRVRARARVRVEDT